MSHFTVAVITKGMPYGDAIEKALAPYQENNMGDCPKEFLEFHSMSAEYKDEYETGTTKRVRTKDGNLLHPWDSSLFVEVTEEEYEKAKAEGRRTSFTSIPHKKWSAQVRFESIGAELVNLPWKEVYATFEEYLESWHDATKDEEVDDYGYWENPNAKWDWWQIGGRWAGRLTVPIECENCMIGEKSWGWGNENPYTETALYRKVDTARIKDLVFVDFDKEYEKAKRFWELHVEGQIPQTEEETEMIKWAFFKPSYYENKYDNKETYAECEATFHTYAVIGKDGKWIAKGEMGWWGVSMSDKNEEVEYIRKYKENVFDNADEDDYITIVDCHI